VIDFDYGIEVPPYQELDRLFVSNAILGMASVSSMRIRVMGNNQVGMDIVRVDEEDILDMHTSDSKEPDEEA